MRYNPLHCWDCGNPVIGGVGGIHEFLPDCRQVKFSLSDGSYCESPFCVQCAEQPWTIDRAKLFEAAVNAVYPDRHHIIVTGVVGYSTPGGPILAVLDPFQAVAANQRR